MAEVNLELTKEQIEEIAEAFSFFDKDEDGFISRDEVGLIMRSLARYPTDEEVRILIETVPKNDKRGVDFLDFLTMMAKQAKHSTGDEELREAFRVFDQTAKGFINAVELRHVMTNVGENLSETEIEEMMKTVDLKEDGKVHYEDVVSQFNAIE